MIYQKLELFLFISRSNDRLDIPDDSNFRSSTLRRTKKKFQNAYRDVKQKLHLNENTDPDSVNIDDESEDDEHGNKLSLSTLVKMKINVSKNIQSKLRRVSRHIIDTDSLSMK